MRPPRLKELRGGSSKTLFRAAPTRMAAGNDDRCAEETRGFRFGCNEDPRRKRKSTEVFTGGGGPFILSVVWRKKGRTDSGWGRRSDCDKSRYSYTPTGQPVTLPHSSSLPPLRIPILEVAPPLATLPSPLPSSPCSPSPQRSWTPAVPPWTVFVVSHQAPPPAHNPGPTPIRQTKTNRLPNPCQTRSCSSSSTSSTTPPRFLGYRNVFRISPRTLTSGHRISWQGMENCKHYFTPSEGVNS